MTLRFAYLAVLRVLALLARSDRAKDAERPRWRGCCQVASSAGCA
jgi:hypothetical protein